MLTTAYVLRVFKNAMDGTSADAQQIPAANPPPISEGIIPSATASHSPTASQSASSKGPTVPSRIPGFSPAVPTRNAPSYGTQLKTSTPGVNLSNTAATLPKQAIAAGAANIGMPQNPMEQPQQPQQPPANNDQDKMQYKWADRVQKIDQAIDKLRLQKDQLRGEIELEQQQHEQNQQLQAEQQAAEEQFKMQKQQEKMQGIQAEMPQNPLQPQPVQ